MSFLFFRYESRYKNLVQGFKVQKERKTVQEDLDREKEIDRLLSKIHHHGINSLTDRERKFLNQASRGYRKRRQ